MPFFGWWIVLTGVLSGVASAATSPHIAGFFLIPMTGALGIGRASFSMVYSIRTVSDGAAGPVVGRLLDRYGPRLLMAAGGVVAGFALMSLVAVQNFWQFTLAMGVFGIASAACMERLVPMVTVARWFVRKRGRAIALVSTGMSIGLAIFSPITQGLIDWIGWRWTWVVLGGFVWILTVPSALAFMRKTPEMMGLKPDGDPVDADVIHSIQDEPHDSEEEPWFSLAMARRTRTFWFLAMSMVLGNGAQSAIAVHQIPAILDNGVSPMAISVGMVVFGLLGILSKIIVGLLAERMSIQLLVVLTMIGTAASLIILMYADSVSMSFAYFVLAGFTRPTTFPLAALVWADYFGRKHLGSIQGAIQPPLLLAQAGGPLLVGILYDWLGGYRMAFSVIIGMYLMAALAMMYAPPPKLPEEVNQ